MVDNSGTSNTGLQGNTGQSMPSDAARSGAPSVSYHAQFAPSPTGQYPVQTAFTPQPPTPQPTPEPEDQDEARRWPWSGIRLSRKARILVLIAAIIALLIGGGVAAFLLWQSNQPRVSQNPVSSAISFDIQQLPLNEISAGTLPALQGSRKLSINGQLEVSNGLIIAPSGQPTGPVAGQLYYDQDTNVLNYFNGDEFVAVTGATDIVNNIGGVSGDITVGAGLNASGGQLSNTGVLSLQASGPLVSSGGQDPTVGLANGTAAGEFWQWDGDSWELAAAGAGTDGDTVVGNEVTDAVIGGGLVVRGSATAADPLKVSLETCALDEVLKSNGSGGWICASDAGGTSYSAGNGLNLNAGQFSVNSPTCGSTDKLQWNGNAFVCSTDVDTDTNTTYSAGNGLNLVGTTFSNTGTLNVTASGAITSSGGQTPNLAFANGTLSGQFWQWNGSAWVLALMPGEQDSVVGNEVLDATASQGLARGGSGTALDPFTLGLQSCADGQVLKSDGSGWICATDDAGSGGTTYSADGQGIELTGTTFRLELDSTSLSKSASGLRLNTANANNWTASQTFGAGLVVGAGQSITLNGDVITDMTGTGLTVAGGSLQTTLGVSVDLGSEVVGTLPVGNGGTGLTALGTAHQLLGMNSAATGLEYKDLGTLIGGGSGILVGGTNVVTITNSGVLSVTGSGPIVSGGGQNPNLTFANGTTNGQFWQWNGSAWALASLPAEQDSVIGNEIVSGTGSNSGLTRSGSGTAGNPYTLAVTTGSGLQVTSNAVGINSPTCGGTDKLQWTGTAFVCATDVDTDTNTTYSALSSGGLRLVGNQFGLSVCDAGEVLKATAVTGEYECATDNDTDTNTTYSADGQGIELTGTTFSLELNGTGLSKGASGLALNLANANTWSGLQTFAAGATVSAGQTLIVNGDAFTDLTGAGLTINTGSLQTTLGASVDLTTEVVGTLPVGNGGTGLAAMGTSNQLLGVNAAGTAMEYKNLSSLLVAGSGIGLSGTNTVTVSNEGVLSVAASGPIASTGGQTPTLTFADGTTPGEFWQWDGDSWELASLPAEQDGVIGNEVTNVTGSNSGLVRSGAGTSGSPYTLAVNPGNGLQVTSNALEIDSPTCAGTDKLQWDGTAFLCAEDEDGDTNTTYTTISNGGLRLVGNQFGLSVCDAGEVLKATAVTGEYECATDDGGTSYTADGQGIELTGTTFGLELNGASISKGAAGLSLNVANANTWSALQTFAAGATVSAGQTLTVNGDAFTDLTGTGLTINTGSLQTTLGTSVSLTSEVVGTLPVGNGGTGLTALGTSNQLLGVNTAGTALEYKNLSSLLVAGSGIGLSGTNTVTVSNDGVLSVAGSGPITSTGGQNPTLTFADGTTPGEFWQWDGDSWVLASLPAEQDSVVGNEVTNVTGSNSGLVRSGAGTAGSPYTLAVNPGDGLQVTSNALGIDSPTCSGTNKLQWNGTDFVCSADVDTDTNTTYSTISNGGLRLVGTQFGLSVCAAGELLKATAVSGEYECATDDGGTAYGADGQGIELTGSTFSLELSGTGLTKSASGLSLNLANANTWTARQTLNAGATIANGQTLTVNGDAFTDLTGTGLTINTGSLQATLGTSVDLTSEVVGTLPVSSGGTGLTALGTSNQLLGVNTAGTALEYKNLSSLLVAGSGIGLSGTNTVTVSNDGVLDVAGSGPITSTGGQNPTLTFADGTTLGEFWQWDGDSWELASLPAEQDAVVGNEVTNVTGSNSGLVRSGSGTGVSPYTLAVNPGNGLQVTSNALGIDSPTCSGTDKLQWNGTDFVCSADVNTDTNTTYSAIANGGLRLSGTQFGLSICAQNQILKATAVSGEYACAADADTDTNTTYTADGQGIELSGTTFSLELNGTALSKSASGLTLNLANANSWSGLQTFAAGATVSAGQTLTVNGDAITDLTGNGLSVSSGVLGINSPTCSGTDKLQWTGTAFTCAADVNTDTNTTYSAISNGGLRLSGTQFGLSICAQNQILKATAVSGEYACAADADTDTNTTYTADGQGIELTGTTFGLELNGATLSKSVSGLSINLGNANTWTALQTYNAGALIAAGQALTLNNDAFTDLTGTGLSISSGVLQTTLGTTVDLAAEVTGILPIANGGTGQATAQAAINSLSGLTTNGDLLYHNGTNATRLARGADGQCLKSNTTTLAWGACEGAIDLQDAYDVSPTGTTPEITLNTTQGALQVRRDSGGTLTDLLYVQDSTGATNYFTAHTAGISVTGSVNAGTGSIIGQTFRTTDQTAAATNSAESFFVSGQVSGTGSTSGQVRIRSGHSITSGSTGNVRITTGDATSGNSGSVILDVGSASGTKGQITIGETNANTIDIGRSSGSNAAVELNGTVTAKPITDVADMFMIQNASGSKLVTLDSRGNTSNLVTNPSFEQNTTSPWQQIQATTTISRYTTDKLYQTASLRMVNSASALRGVKYVTQLANGTYAFSFYAKERTTDAVNGLVFGYSDSGSTANIGGSDDCVAVDAYISTFWTRYTCTFTAASATASAFIYIAQDSAVAGDILIDGVQLTSTTVGVESQGFYEGLLNVSGTALSGTVTIQGANVDDPALQMFGGSFSITNTNGGKSLRVRTTGNGIGLETAQGDLYISGYSNSGFAGDPIHFLRTDMSTGWLYVGDGVSGSDATLLVLDDKNSSASDPSGVDGSMYYNTVSDSFRCMQNGQWRSCAGGVVFANTSVPAGNTITANGVDTKFASSYTIPGNDCQPGRVYRITGQGLYSTGASNAHAIKVF